MQRALIGTDARGVAVILATDGAGIAAEVEANDSNASAIGLVKRPIEPGLYLWVGFSQLEHWGPDSGETEVVYHGNLRPVRPEEIAELYAMEPPVFCIVCGKIATTHYPDDEDAPLCGLMRCGFQYQRALDYSAERGS